MRGGFFMEKISKNRDNAALCQVTFLREGRTVQVSAGSTIMNAARSTGIFPDAPCGGQGTCGKCLVQLKTDGGETKTVLACQTKVWKDLTVDTQRLPQKHQILTNTSIRRIKFSPSSFPKDVKNPYLVAFDIGTTTIASYLIDGNSGKEICTAGMVNPQTAYGADVISRADYCMQHKNTELSSCIHQALDDLITALAEKQQISREQIVQLCLVGNTCMHHIFFDFPMDSLVLAPYRPYQKGLLQAKAADFGIQIHPQGQLFFLPVIAGFVGADTMGCLLALRPDLSRDITLLVDIGTNGEIVLGNREKLVCCSTAAGPAFEGAKIECGMRGAEGAIDHVNFSHGKFQISVIGNQQPTGICGSGLIDAVACLRKLGIIDEMGRLLARDEVQTLYGEELASHMTTQGNLTAFVFQKEYPSVYLTQKDIREVQLAKGAIAAGILLLEKHLGITHSQIDRVCIAGAFGTYMSPDSACAIGLLPSALQKKIVPVGNAAGEGAKIALLNKAEREYSQTLMNQLDFLELAMLSEFQDCFIDELEFPPTEP